MGASLCSTAATSADPITANWYRCAGLQSTLAPPSRRTGRRRAEEPDRLMEWGFREFENVVLFKTAEVVEEVPVWLGSRPTVPLIFGGREGRDEPVGVRGGVVGAE